MDYVLRKAEAGAKIKFYYDYYGAQYVVVSEPWLPWLKRRVPLSHDEIQQVKQRLMPQRRVKAGIS
jgi:hypothetical protein